MGKKHETENDKEKGLELMEAKTWDKDWIQRARDLRARIHSRLGGVNGISVFLTLALFLFYHSLTVADEKSDKVDQLFEEFDSTHTPGVTVAIIQDDKIIYKKAFGMASLELGVPNSTRTVFRLGSVSKQFTAACIAMLALDNKLSLDGPLTKFFPELPKEVYGPVTIRHMIHHTSGIRDSEAMYPLMGIDYSQWYTHKMFLNMLARQKSLNFKPGERFEYSNSAYTLLALIVEKVSGQPFDQFITAQIFTPLGMENTRIQMNHRTFILHRAAGYASSSNQYDNWMTNNQLVGHDAIYSSVEDLFHWLQSFFNGKLGDRFVEMVTTPGTFNDGSINPYAFGLVVHKYKGLQVYLHSGWYVGYVAFLVIFPEQRFSVVCLSNLGNYNPEPLCFEIAEIYLADQIAESQSKSAHQKIAESFFTNEVLEDLSGEYVGIDFGGFLSLETKDNKLHIKPGDFDLEPSPYSKSEFTNHQRHYILRIQPETVGTKKITLEVLLAFGSFGRYQPFKEIALKEDEIFQFTGEYRSDEIEKTCQIIDENGSLFFKLSNLSSKLSHFEKDQFAAEWAKVTFFRGEGDTAIGFRLDKYGVQNLIFKKVETNSK